MKEIYTSSDASTLGERYRLRGRVRLHLDETIVPVLPMGDYAGSSPYEAGRRLGMFAQNQAGGGAGRFSGVAITPAPNTILVIESIGFQNTTGVVQQMEGSIQPERVVTGAAVTIVSSIFIPRTDTAGAATALAQQVDLASTFRLLHANARLGNGVDRLFFINSAAGAADAFVRLNRGVQLDARAVAAGEVPSLLIQTAAANQTTPVMQVQVAEYDAL